jgi:uncharacterized membrane protein YbhN (UPF0104 family)
MSRAANRWWTITQVLIVAVVLWWAGRALAQQWDAVRAVALHTTIQWVWVAAASLVVLATFAALIQSWRLLLAGMGGHLGFWTAARIWTVANLGRYLPGKIWSVGALGILAKRAGVSDVAAASAAIVGTLLNIGAGLGILAMSGSRVLGAFKPWLQTVATVGAILFVAGTLVLPMLLPPVLRRLAEWRRQPLPPQTLPKRTLWLATSINVISWVAYGLAFSLFAKGVAPGVLATPLLFVVIWTASYLSGYLSLIVPGGLGVREVAMAGALVAFGLAGLPEATFLALASRVWLTIWEIIPGVAFILATAIQGRRDPRAVA